MTHGTPDYGVTNSTVTTYQLTDLGELAARLWSIDTYDRRGEVAFMEDFECGVVRFQTLVGAAGAAAAADQTQARSGQNCYKLTGGNVAGQPALIVKELPLAKSTPIGQEVSVNPATAASTMRLLIDYFDGVTVHEFQLKVAFSSGNLSYENAAGADVVFGSVGVMAGDGFLFHTLKLVADPTTDHYVRAIVDGVQFDMSALIGRAVAVAGSPYLYCNTGLLGRAGFNDVVYVDDWIITYNEPV